MIDKYGREITDNGDGSWTEGGMTIGSAAEPRTEAQALSTFNGMAPHGWFDPTPNEIIQQQIVALEEQQTPRRMREALSDPTFINGLNSEIAALRAQLSGE